MNGSSRRRKMQQAIKGKACGQAAQRFLALGKSYEGRAAQALPGHSSSSRGAASAAHVSQKNKAKKKHIGEGPPEKPPFVEEVFGKGPRLGDQ